MNAKSISSVLVGLCITAPVIAGQAQGTTKKVPSKPAAAQPAHADKMTATSHASEIAVPVTGLTADNAAKVKSALSGISQQVWTCSACHTESGQPGTCEECDAELKAEKLPVLDVASVAAEGEMLHFALKPHRSLSLNELDGVLRKNAVSVDSGKMKLPASSTLVLTNVTQDQLSAIEKELVDSKLFSSAHASLDARTKQVRVQAVAAATAPTRSAVETLVAGLSQHPRLEDVVIGTMPMPRG